MDIMHADRMEFHRRVKVRISQAKSTSLAVRQLVIKVSVFSKPLKPDWVLKNVRGKHVMKIKSRTPWSPTGKSGHAKKHRASHHMLL